MQVIGNLFQQECDSLHLEGGLYVYVSRDETSSMLNNFSKNLPLQSVMWNRGAQCIDEEILIRKKCNIDIGIDIDKANFEKLITYWYW